MRGARALVAVVIAISIAPVPAAGASAGARKFTRTPAYRDVASGMALRLDSVPASGLPTSPFSGDLTVGSDDDDVFTVPLAAGQRLSVSVSGGAGSDIDCYLLWPEATSLIGSYAASSYTTSYPETLTFDAPVSGTYYLDLYCAGDSTTYTASYSITKAKGTGGVVRLYGPDRYSTSLAISRATFKPNSSNDVVLAGGVRYPDALTASALAGALGCPLMLTTPDKLAPGLLTEIKRVGADQVHIVGGPASVSDNVRVQLNTAGISVKRYEGRDRFVVARSVAKTVGELNPRMDATAFLASGEVFPDALSASPYAYRKGYPILLTRADTLHPQASAVLTELKIKTVYISGGPRSVSAAIEQQLRSRGITVVRLSGSDRYSTSAAVAGYAVRKHWGDPSFVSVASGEVFPDALSGGSATGAVGGTMVITPASRLGTQADAFVTKWAGLGLVDRTRIFGGPRSVSSNVERSLLMRVAQ